MKILTVAFVALYLMFTISGTTCNDFMNKNNTVACKSINDYCNSNVDCCYQKCGFSITSMRSICKDNSNLYNFLTPYINTEDQNGYCLYTTPTDMEISDETYNTYGLSVAHPDLYEDTIVEVIINSKKLVVKVNNHRSTAKGVILELSREVAEIMNIESGKKVRCEVFVPTLDNNVYFRYFMYIFPYACLFMIIHYI